jgi:hypothetical protein
VLLEATEGVDIAERAIALIRELRELFADDSSLVPAELMRLALLEGEQNLAVSPRLHSRLGTPTPGARTVPSSPPTTYFCFRTR